MCIRMVILYIYIYGNENNHLLPFAKRSLGYVRNGILHNACVFEKRLFSQGRMQQIHTVYLGSVTRCELVSSELTSTSGAIEEVDPTSLMGVAACSIRVRRGFGVSCMFHESCGYRRE